MLHCLVAQHIPARLGKILGQGLAHLLLMSLHAVPPHISRLRHLQLPGVKTLIYVCATAFSGHSLRMEGKKQFQGGSRNGAETGYRGGRFPATTLPPTYKCPGRRHSRWLVLWTL